MKKILIFSLLCLPLLLSCSGDKSILEITDLSGKYQARIQLEGMRFEFLDAQGKPLLASHETSGFLFNGSGVRSARLLNTSGREYRFLMVNEKAEEAELSITVLEHGFRMALKPAEAHSGALAARLKALAPDHFYGLADYGLHGNLWGLQRQLISNDGGHNRFVSSFAIAPALGFAQVAILQQGERHPNGDKPRQYVSLNADEISLEFEGVQEFSHLYYFFGEPEDIYGAFSKAKKAAAYADEQPQYRAFGLGWEAWPQLSWRTNAEVVTQSVAEFLERDIELDWAILGSGFWEQGGTTTSFGRWNQAENKYPEPEAFLNWFAEKGIPLMLGLRSQFVDGLGSNAGSGRDGSYGIYLEGKPVPREYTEGLEKRYFARQGDALFASASNVFPQWDKQFAVLDSDNPKALQWYWQKAGLWGAAGWKEDSMLTADAGIYHDGHWNPIMSGLHKRGDLVIARNAYTSSPGSLQRINDTHGEEDRIPQLVLAYGASAAPNVYTDIVGNAEQGNEQYLIRHSQLQALTAGMSLGIRPWELSDRAENAIVSAIQWHRRYRPHFHSEALKSYVSGFPYTSTPLYLKYPHDSEVHALHGRKQWQWMIGENLLAHPLFDKGQLAWERDVYLPEGRWLDPNSGERFEGPQILKNYPHPMDAIPVFIGGNGVLIAESNSASLEAEVWPLNQGDSQFQYQHCRALHCSEFKEINIELKVKSWAVDQLALFDIKTGETIILQRQTKGQFVFPVEVGGDYRLQNLQ